MAAGAERLPGAPSGPRFPGPTRAQLRHYWLRCAPSRVHTAAPWPFPHPVPARTRRFRYPPCALPAWSFRLPTPLPPARAPRVALPVPRTHCARPVWPFPLPLGRARAQVSAPSLGPVRVRGLSRRADSALGLPRPLPTRARPGEAPPPVVRPLLRPRPPCSSWPGGRGRSARPLCSRVHGRGGRGRLMPAERLACCRGWASGPWTRGLLQRS